MISAEDEAYYMALRERAAKWRRDQSARQAALDAAYAARRDALIEADVQKMLAMDEGWDDGEATALRR